MSYFLETVFTDGLAHLSYVIGEKESGSAAVVDPRRDVEIYREIARKHGVVITHVLETHIHADFVSGACQLVSEVPTAKAYLSVEGKAKYGFSHEKLRDRTTITLGSLLITALHTPGHTPEHMSFCIAEVKTSEVPFAIFTGDCLFADSVGRPDLLGERQAKELAKRLFNSLHTVYGELPDEVLVYPTHGSGSPCGADIGDRRVTSLGYERKNNKALQLRSEAEFVDYVLRTAPPEPTYYARMKEVNAGGPEVLSGLPACPSLLPKAFKKEAEKRGRLTIDNRQMLAFGGGHIGGSLNIGPKPLLSIWAGWLVDPKDVICLVLTRPEDLVEVQKQLLRVGVTNFGGVLAGGIEAWIESGLSISSIAQLSVHALDKRRQADEIQIVDIRSPEEWEKGHIPGAEYIFLPEIQKKKGKLKKTQPVAVYCASGYRASIGASLLSAEGFTQVHNVPGSWEAWQAADLPVEESADDKKASDTNR